MLTASWNIPSIILDFFHKINYNNKHKISVSQTGAFLMKRGKNRCGTESVNRIVDCETQFRNLL